MVLTKEYRICMPITVQEYHIGQRYMIARHSLEQSSSGEGVEVIENQQCEDSQYGCGVFTEKRIHLSSRLPYWIQSMIPKVFYLTEKAWNYYPYTLTEYNCSFLPPFRISIQTCYLNNNGSSENALNLDGAQLKTRHVEHMDIAYDEVSPKHYKDGEDPRYFKSEKTHRGPLVEGWRNSHQPIMCSYKLVSAFFEVWGLQSRVEDFIHSCIREVLLVGHRQAFTWIDEWIDMSFADVRRYEERTQAEANGRLHSLPSAATDQTMLLEGDIEGTNPTAMLEEVSPSELVTPTSSKQSYISSWFGS